MATLEGTILLNGKLGGISFYKQGSKILARKAKGPSRKQVMTGAGYETTRKHISEFGNCSNTGKIIRESVKIAFPKSDECHQRLVKLLWQIIKLDPSEKGIRTVAGGLRSEAGRALLSGFCYNSAGEKHHFSSLNHRKVVVQFEIPGYDQGKGKTVLKLVIRQINSIESPWKNNLVITEVEIK